MRDEKKLDDLLYTDENLMNIGMWERQRKKQLMVIFFLVVVN
jgi:predicted nucleic acid-binding Zn ribbon protein